jgi:hypothetical protein
LNQEFFSFTQISICFVEFVFSGQHARTVNRVRFHENDAYLLLSGSQDGSMHIFVSFIMNKACVTNPTAASRFLVSGGFTGLPLIFSTS